MYLHIGNKIMIDKKDIIALCDMDNITSTEAGILFLKMAEKGRIIDDSSELLPKSFIVVEDKFSRFKVYTSCLNTSTLRKRINESIY